ncbi:MAG: hypothetical protein MUF11_05640 [Beijerinckiaceae bacterium]|jgi:hypothetical protein|nr:hypothetical protein [Beijerinckiaceae bacterium]
MSDVAQVPGMSDAMTAAVAVMRAAQDMAANTVALVSPAETTAQGRAPLPYSKVLDKLA